MHLKPLFQQLLELILSTALHQHVPVGTCRLVDFVVLGILIAFTMMKPVKKV